MLFSLSNKYYPNIKWVKALSIQTYLSLIKDKIYPTDLWGVLYVGRNKAGNQKLEIIGCYQYSDQLPAASHYYNYFHDATEFASHASHTNHLPSPGLSASKHQHHDTTLMVSSQEINQYSDLPLIQ